MPTVDFITYCCPKDIHKTYAGWDRLVQSHNYAFHEVILIRQRCKDIDAGTLDPSVRILETEDYPDILGEFGIDENDQDAERASPYNTKFYWKWNTMNPLIGLKESNAEYIMFTDCDNWLEWYGSANDWIERGVSILQSKPEVIMICPNQWDGQRENMITKDVSQCMFLCNKQRFRELDYNVPNPVRVELGGYHYIFEGRVWRYVQNNPVWRMFLMKPPILRHQAW